MIKKLLKSVRENKLAAIMTPIIVMGEVVMEVLIPYVIASLIDKGIGMQSTSEIYRYAIYLGVFSICALIFGALAGITSAKASSGYAKNLRQDLYYKIMSFSFKNIDRFSTSSLITRLTTDVTNVQRAFMMSIRIAVRCPSMIIFSLVMAARINLKLSLIYLITIPIVGLGLFLIARKAFPIMTRIFKTYDELNNIVEENVRGIRVVKSFVQEKKEKSKFEDVSNRIYKDFSKGEIILSLNSPLLQSSIYICMILISWLGAKMIVNSNMTLLTTGELTTFISYTFQILFSLMMLTMVLIMFTISSASAKRIVEVLDEEPDIKNKEGACLEVKNGDIEFNNVSFSYVNDKKKEVLKNINLKILSGQTVGILGGTGSGKTSLVSLISRLYDITEGSLKVGGVEVSDYDIKTLRDSVAVVLQKNELFSGSIKENLRWGNENATDEEIEKVCKVAMADEFIQGLNDKYDTHIEQGGTNISGGQKQRLTIARALLKKPKIIILDDSTSAVDTRTDMKIRDNLKNENKDMTKIIIAQRVASVETADIIVILDNGSIAGIGSHDELIKTNEIYKEVYESQTKGGK